MGASSSKDDLNLHDTVLSTLKTLESMISTLQTQPDSASYSPPIEALILLLSRIHLVLTQDYLDQFTKLGDNFLVPEETFQALKAFKLKVEKSAKEIQTLLEKAQFEGIPAKIEPLTTNFHTVSKKKLTIFLPEYSKEESNFFDSFEPLVEKLVKIHGECKDRLEKGLKSLIAVQFWERNFKGLEEVGFKEFEDKFSLLTVQMHKLTLKPAEVEKISKLFPQGKVGKREVDELVWKTWNVSFRRKELVGR